MAYALTPSSRPSLLLIGASRGLGHAMAAEFVSAGWRVVGTVRGTAQTPLHDLAEAHGDQIAIETLDMTVPDQIAALGGRLSGQSFDMLFVNAGTANSDPMQTIGTVSTDEFIRVMVTNALGPLRVIEGLDSLVAPTGLIGIMSSGQGSVSNNETGQREVYRGSKAALNQYMRCYAARDANKLRPMALMAPGWVKTELGGPDAKLTIEESIPSLVAVLFEKRNRPGLEYLDYRGQTVPW
ncbi:SDR family oxidoreductase [Jiella sp. MQZ9-1]|uniref:SDR family oxidoreductase n=1 Tax=Jiella flava TaxID=2816857 RepID=A0A939G3L5_9HYPH|nr:SDR family NAD(P)-dependent oxidoreductase [Jiella flava]MBO0664454.1 SDR family oxidoreductase [Jiella flava]MCD2473090.1 SDR family oxidoreductase [Jiella flava]